jgi:hypothetical protein
MTQVAAKASKSTILDAFQKLLAERQQMASRVATKEEEAELEQNQKVLEAVSQYTADSIVRGLADLQLEFGGIIGDLSTRLSTETTKLDELKQAIAIETQRLQALQKTRIVADALYILTQEHQENLRLLEQRLAQERETLTAEMAETRKVWQREQAEFEATVTEGDGLAERERERQEADYAYNTERSRKIATDEYEEKKRQIERELQVTTEAKEKQWAEREAVLTANGTLLAQYQTQVAAFPAELEEAIKKSREDGIRDANQDAKVKADLLAKEWEATQQGYELQIQSLDLKIQRQSEQINEISLQLQAATRQAQELAMRAFESAPRAA